MKLFQVGTGTEGPGNNISGPSVPGFIREVRKIGVLLSCLRATGAFPPATPLTTNYARVISGCCRASDSPLFRLRALAKSVILAVMVDELLETSQYFGSMFLRDRTVHAVIFPHIT